MFLRESQEQPLLLVFEDLHWIDSETQALLNSLVESLPTTRLLLLVNYRPEYQHGWGSKAYYTQLRLDPLEPASAEEILQALLGDAPSLTPLTSLLLARTQGNPFFLEESVRTLVETVVLVGEPGAYSLGQALPTIQVPATVQAVLAARIDRLPAEANASCRPPPSLAMKCLCPCCRPLPRCPRRACIAVSPRCRRRSSSTRRACSPRVSIRSSMPSPTRWPMGVSSRSADAGCMPGLSRPSKRWWGTG